MFHIYIWPVILHYVDNYRLIVSLSNLESVSRGGVQGNANTLHNGLA